MKRNILVNILLLVFVSGSAFGQTILNIEGWGKTKWGMSIVEVSDILNASWKTAVNLNEGRSGLKPLFRITLNDGINDYFVDLMFGSGKLELVTIYSITFTEKSALYNLAMKYGVTTGQYVLELSSGYDKGSIKYWWWRFQSTGILLVSDSKTYEMNKRIQYPSKDSEVIYKDLRMPSSVYIEFSPNNMKVWLP